MEQPICTSSGGIIRYMLHGKLHREDGPACIFPDGTEYWMQHDECHRTDGPSIIFSDGREEFWLNGKEVDVMVHFLQRP